MNRAIFLDRDGVLNQMIFRRGEARAPYALEELTLLNGVKEALELLKHMGYVLIVVTNQPDVAKGWVSREAVDAINVRLRELLPLDDLYACFHTERDNCDCRKPRPGMLLKGVEKHHIDPSCSWMIGDRESDIEAGLRAGCKTILLGDEKPHHMLPDYHFKNLWEAVQTLVSLHALFTKV